ncbi:MAG: hypothetical protein HQM10_04760 [Candidatus Riflebacteria bacterium]|nr:hypothetical protein [Candidatus Riflebacteria bacterium]
MAASKRVFLFCFIALFCSTLLQGATLVEFAKMALESHRADRNDFDCPEDWSVLSTHLKLRDGFMAVAFQCNRTSEVIISFSGTHFTDPEDLLADLGIVKSDIESLKEAIEVLMKPGANPQNPDYQKAKQTIAKTKSSMIDSPDQKVTDQIIEAREFYQKVLTLLESKKRFDILHKDIDDNASNDKQKVKISVCGHSLGGFLAQIIAYENKLPCHTFNSPGAAGIFKKELSSQLIVNHIRMFDLTGYYGKHIGSVLVYPEVNRTMTNFYMPFFIRNHVMGGFYEDLQNGMLPMPE